MVFDVLPFELLLLFIPTGRMGRAPNVCDDGSIVALGKSGKTEI
jgi:hypothetical protein